MTTTKNKRSYENRSRSSCNHLALSFSEEANRRVEYGYSSFIPTAMIQRATGPHEDLLTIVKRRKLKWNGHVFRSSGLAKTILQGTVKGGRRQDRQKKRSEDNIREWTGLEVRQVPEGSGERRKLEKTGCEVISHLWCPNDPRG